jgi:hypothetical protein
LRGTEGRLPFKLVEIRLAVLVFRHALGRNRRDRRIFRRHPFLMLLGTPLMTAARMSLLWFTLVG